MKRRTFITKTGAVAAAACTCGIGMNSCSMITGISNTSEASQDSFQIEGQQIVLDLEKIPELAETGSSVKLRHDQEPDEPLKVLIIKTGENEYLAFENRCTHAGREIAYDPDLERLRCVSFSHSKYDIQGGVTDGPAHGPLKVYQTSIAGKNLVIDIS